MTNSIFPHIEIQSQVHLLRNGENSRHTSHIRLVFGEQSWKDFHERLRAFVCVDVLIYKRDNGKALATDLVLLFDASDEELQHEVLLVLVQQPSILISCRVV